MNKPSFLARTTLGQPRYLLLAMACVFVIALIPSAARRALNGTSHNIDGWLPASSAEVQDLAWFREHFQGEQFALVSWDRCTLGNDESLELLARKLQPADSTLSNGSASADAAHLKWYDRVITGPQVVKQLMQSQVGLSYTAAIKRLEGALIGPLPADAGKRAQGNDARATCMVVFLSPAALADRANLRTAIESISDTAQQCGIDAASLHMAGPAVDNVAIDAEGRRTMARVGGMSVLLGIGASYWRLRSARLTAIVVGMATIGAGLSLAIVSNFGAFEVLVMQRAAPLWGTLDALLLGVPAVIFLLAISAAVHAVNYYTELRGDARATGTPSMSGVAERAVLASWRTSAVASLAAAAAMAALFAADVVPMQKFGVFTALSIIATVAMLFMVMPVLLHRFPLGEAVLRRGQQRSATPSDASTWGSALSRVVTQHGGLTLAAGLLLMLLLGAGLRRVGASVDLLAMVDRRSDLIQDYAWLERNIGNLVPLEVVLTMPPERLRTGDEHAEADGQQYRLTMLERLELLRQIERRLAAFPQISRAMSAATFTPATAEGGLVGSRAANYARNKALEFNSEQLFATDYLRLEQLSASEAGMSRELWRLSARVAALPQNSAPTDYGVFIGQLKRAIEPVLWSYQQRDIVVRALHQRGKQLAGSRVCVLFRAAKHATAPSADVQEHTLAALLSDSGVAPRGVTYFNLATFDRPAQSSPEADEHFRANALNTLRDSDAVILASAASDPTARQLVLAGVTMIDATQLPDSAENVGAPLSDDGGPRPIRAVFTGPGPIIERTQRLIVGSLESTLQWSVLGVLAIVVLGTMNVTAGALLMIPTVFPLAVVFGAMGWLGVKADLGMAMTAGVALALAVESSLHLVNWFGREMSAGLSRRDAVRGALRRSGGASVNAAWIAGFCLVAMAFSAFTPMRQFALLTSAMLASSLISSLVLLPAMLATPLGWFFAPADIRRADPLWSQIQAWRAARLPRRRPAPAAAPSDAPALLPAPHFADEPAPVRRTVLNVSSDQRRELAEGPHSALHAKLQGLRRPRTGDSTAS